MQFVEGDPTAVTDATWYRCKKGAVAFPGAHAFGSPVWDIVHPTPTTLGFDATASRRYYNGRRLNSSDGQKVAGHLEWFLTGAPSKANLPRLTDGTPVECIKPPFGKMLGGVSVPVAAAIGGKSVGGALVTTVIPGAPCTSCPGVTPATVVLTITGATGLAAVINGVWMLPQDVPTNPCLWTHNEFPVRTFDADSFPAPWAVFVSTQFGLVTGIYTGSPGNCVTPMTLNLTTPQPGYPPTIQISFL